MTKLWARLYPWWKRINTIEITVTRTTTYRRRGD